MNEMINEAKQLEKFFSMLSPATLALLRERTSEYRSEVEKEEEGYEVMWCMVVENLIDEAIDSKS